MLEHVIALPPRRLHLKSRKLPIIWLLAMLVAASALGLMYGFSSRVTNLGSSQALTEGIRNAWHNGDMILLVRHAERCDRSNHACLSDSAGITVDGSRASATVGDGIRHLGLVGADIFTSPEARTQQTASFAFGKAVETQQWLARCDSSFADAVLAHKREGHNLVLVTHSGCIDHLERKFGVAGGERSAGYASTLFVSSASHGTAHLLGQLNANQWPAFTSHAGS